MTDMSNGHQDHWRRKCENRSWCSDACLQEVCCIL